MADETPTDDSEVIRLLVLMAEALMWSTTRETMREWVANPRFGDLVLIDFARPDAEPNTRIGTYDATWTYVYPPDDGMSEDQPFRDRASQQVYGVVSLDGTYIEWTDVRLWRIPRTREELWEMTS